MNNGELKESRFILAATGGSGSAYTLRMLYRLAEVPGQTTCVFSPNFFRVLEQETGIQKFSNTDMLSAVHIFFKKEKPGAIRHSFIFSDYHDIGAEAASGSAKFRGMIILPCSMKTLGGIAGGITTNLAERAADVCLKERRTLLVCPRETPLNLIHIENMRTITLSGGVVMPIAPGYYHKPESLIDLYDFMCDRIFSHMGIENTKLLPWIGNQDTD